MKVGDIVGYSAHVATCHVSVILIIMYKCTFYLVNCYPTSLERVRDYIFLCSTYIVTKVQANLVSLLNAGTCCRQTWFSQIWRQMQVVRWRWITRASLTQHIQHYDSLFRTRLWEPHFYAKLVSTKYLSTTNALCVLSNLCDKI